MTDLRQSLIKSEFSHLKVVAEKWELPFDAPDARQGLDLLVDSLFASQKLAELDNILTVDEVQALVWLDDRDGRDVWDHFARQFGEIREVGAGKLDRERPDLAPISAAEGLWYRALIARGFFESESGLLEFAYIPDDIRELALPLLNPERKEPSEGTFLCRVAVPKETEERQLTSIFILDHVCTILAGLRMGQDPVEHLPGVTDPERSFYQMLLVLADLLDGKLSTLPEKLRQYYDLTESEALVKLWKAWLVSETHHDLTMVDGIQVEGVPELDPIPVRERLIAPLKDLDPQVWWSMESFVSQLKERSPDFLRSAGEYEAMFIKDEESGAFLTGFSSWDTVEGELIRYILTGPLHWLGLIDLAGPAEDNRPLAFRLGKLFQDFIGGDAPDLPTEKPDPIQIRSKGEIRVTMDVAHKVRYQIARFCEWGSYKADAYYYFITPASLTRAEKQGLKVSHLLSLLKNHTKAIPPNVMAALERWYKQGIQASISQKTIMRLGSPAVLKALKKSPAERYILEQLGPTVVIIKEGSEEKIAQALVELGFFVGIEDQTGSQT
ncbi:MAG: hypothetical protein DRI65_15640 [Chloroflexota bacterium]|nr:MAG: hypothetical protein DRI65_15640 [Chloroflexota bacterium]